MSIFARFLKMRYFLFALTVLVVLASSGCKNSYNRLLKKGTINEKYAAANKYYEKKNYFRAAALYEEVMSVFRGRRESEEMYFKYAMCHFQMDEFSVAGYHFKTFSETYPQSDYAEEASFHFALSEYEKALPSYLDQTNTKLAIQKFQIFINRYPESKRIPECNVYMDDLRAFLLKKAYTNSKLYYRVGDYKAAMVAFENAIKDYPDIPSLLLHIF